MIQDVMSSAPEEPSVGFGRDSGHRHMNSRQRPASSRARTRTPGRRSRSADCATTGRASDAGRLCTGGAIPGSASGYDGGAGRSDGGGRPRRSGSLKVSARGAVRRASELRLLTRLKDRAALGLGRDKWHRRSPLQPHSRRQRQQGKSSRGRCHTPSLPTVSLKSSCRKLA